MTLDVTGDRVLATWSDPSAPGASVDRALFAALAGEALAACAYPARDPGAALRALAERLGPAPPLAAGAPLRIALDPALPEVPWTALELPGGPPLSDLDLWFSSGSAPPTRSPGDGPTTVAVATRAPRPDARGRPDRPEEVDVLVHLFDGVALHEGEAPADIPDVLHVAGRSPEGLAARQLLVLPHATPVAAAMPGPDGPRAVLTSQWSLDDRGRARVFREFYAGLAEGRTPAGALRRARDRVRGGPATTSPHHWAGFVLVGGDLPALRLAEAPRRWGWIMGGVFVVTAGVWFLLTRREARRG